MLARHHRVTSGADYRRISRRGRRVGAPGFIVLAECSRDAASPTRFGFIITKRVGVAVVRNRMRRRLKAICFEALPLLPTGLSIVIRVFPESASIPYAQLRAEVRAALVKAAEQAGLLAIPEECSCSDVVD
ncbi:ribonuclease P protein component [Gulosibacter bifidus]|uniref:Ribonuclease P protein component n=1 Tax=Gulosibacter bifidus TaxID=272239 RepID=A0ABW5RIZ1_9MICO|nr:ribonuclease P protein component [Gulosibacter bifidus]